MLVGKRQTPPNPGDSKLTMPEKVELEGRMMLYVVAPRERVIMILVSFFLEVVEHNDLGKSMNPI